MSFPPFLRYAAGEQVRSFLPSPPGEAQGAPYSCRHGALQCLGDLRLQHFVVEVILADPAVLRNCHSITKRAPKRVTQLYLGFRRDTRRIIW